MSERCADPESRTWNSLCHNTCVTLDASCGTGSGTSWVFFRLSRLLLTLRTLPVVWLFELGKTSTNDTYVKICCILMLKECRLYRCYDDGRQLWGRMFLHEVRNDVPYHKPRTAVKIFTVFTVSDLMARYCSLVQGLLWKFISYEVTLTLQALL